MDDRPLVAVIFAILMMMVASFAGGMIVRDDLIKNDCVRFEAFYIGGKRYECRVVTEGVSDGPV